MRNIWFGLLVLLLIVNFSYAGNDKATINAGAIKSNLLSNGMMGDTTTGFDEPAGFFPYHDYKSLFRLGSLWLGGSVDGKRHFDVSAGYVSYVGAINNEWVGDASGVNITTPGSLSPLELSINLTDTNTAVNSGNPLGIGTELKIHQWSYAPLDKFYILQYKFKNNSFNTVDSMYAGIYHLPNVFRDAVNNSSALDFCGFDESADPVNGGSRDMLWVTADSGQCATGFGVNPNYFGIRLLQAVDPSGNPSQTSGASCWTGVDMEPSTDANILNPYSKYYYLSRNKKDAGEIRKVHRRTITDDSLHINFFGNGITGVEGVWDVNDTNHLGINYYPGGSYDSEMGVITLGIPKGDKTLLMSNETVWPSDTMTLTVSVIPLAQVVGVYDNPLDTGINYYTGGSFVSSTGTVTLGTPYFGGTEMYVSYYYKVNNVIVTYNYYYNKVLATPWDAYTLQIDPTRVQNVEGVYWAKDSTCSGTNYFIGGTFDRASGMINLATPIDQDSAVETGHYTFTYDASWNPTDNTVMVDWMDPSKVVEILSVLDASSTDHYPGGSYDPFTGTITLGIPFGEVNYNEVWVSYRYLATPNVWVRNFAPELATQNVLVNVGPWTMSPADSGMAVFAVVAGNTLAELQSASDSAKYIWDNPSASIASTTGSISGMVYRTEGRGPVANAKVVLFGNSGSSIDSAYTDVTGRYFIGNVENGSYDSLVASADLFASSQLDLTVPVTAVQNLPGQDLALVSTGSDLTGKITRADGITPVVSAKVYIKGVNNDSTVTDASGNYSFNSINTAVSDSLIITAQYCLSDTLADVELLQDSTKIINLSLHSTTGWIDGQITKTDGITPIGNVQVQAVTGIDTFKTTSDGSGQYSIGGLMSANYSVFYNASWFASDSTTGVVVTVDSTTRSDISLRQENNVNALIWKKKSAMPSWRYGAASCMVQGKIYVFGGRDYLGSTNTTLCYDPAADTLGGDPWSIKTPMSSSRYGLGAAAVGDSIIYLIGGYDADSNAVSTNEAYKPASDTWVTGLASMPTPRAFLGVASISDSVYTAGGMNSLSSGLDTVEVYLTGTDSWVTPKALLGGVSNGRAGIGFATLDSLGTKRVYCMGGQKADGTVIQTNIKYNPATNAWATRTSIPWLTAYSSATTVNDTFFIIGGRNNSDGYMRKVGIYNTFANNWILGSDYPLNVSYHSSASKDSLGLWVLGGKTDDTYITDAIYMGYKPGAISGVCNTTTEGPVSGAVVSVYSGPQEKNDEMTDASGGFLLAGLEPGLYRVHIYKAGIMDTTLVDVPVSWGRITSFIVTGVNGERPEVKPLAFALNPAYPNPSRGYCNINFQIPHAAAVELSIYNVLGQKVKTLASGKMGAGNYDFKWSGDDNNGNRVSNGIYLYRLQMKSGTFSETATKKLVLVK